MGEICERGCIAKVEKSASFKMIFMLNHTLFLYSAIQLPGKIGVN